MLDLTKSLDEDGIWQEIRLLDGTYVDMNIFVNDKGELSVDIYEATTPKKTSLRETNTSHWITLREVKNEE